MQARCLTNNLMERCMRRCAVKTSRIMRWTAIGLALVLLPGCSTIYGDSCADEGNLAKSEYKFRNCDGGPLSAKKQRATTYDGDDTARLWTGEAIAPATPFIDTRKLNRPPGIRQGFTGYVGSLRVDYAANPEELATDISNIRISGSTNFDPEEKITLNFEKAALSFFLKQLLGGALGVNYIAPNDIDGTISFKTEQPVPKGQVLQVVRDVLSRNGLTMRFLNGVYHIAKPDAMATIEQTSAAGRAGEQVTRMVRIRKGSVTDIISFAKQVLSDDVTLTSGNGGDTIIIHAQENEVGKIAELITSLSDGRIAEDRVAIIPLRQSAPERVALHLTDFYRARLGANSGDAVTVVPLENQQAILIGAKDKRIMAGIRELVAQLDQETTDDAGLRVITLVYLEAEQVTKHLTALFGQGGPTTAEVSVNTNVATGAATGASVQTTEPTPRAPMSPALPLPPATGADISNDGSTISPGFNLGGGGRGARDGPKGTTVRSPGSAVKFVADNQNNTVLVYSPYSMFKRIREVLRALDVPQSQVVIEATIAEVSLNDDLQHGVQAYLSAAGVVSARSGTDPAPLNANQTDKVGGFAHLTATKGILQADVVLNALQVITTVKVISSPYLTVLDGKTARLVIGDQIPYALKTQQTQLSGTTTTTQEVQVKDTGIVLEVTPSVRPDNSAVLKINQQVTKPQDSAFTGNLTPTISTREVKSEILTQSGRTVLLGGLIQDRIDRGENAIPVVRSVPIFGDLFKQVDDRTSRVELIMLITPRIIRHTSQIENITRLLKGQLHIR
jgi:general secretion pathway protein D